MTKRFPGGGRITLISGILLLGACRHAPAPSGESSLEFNRPAPGRGGGFQSLLTGSEPKNSFIQASPDGPLALPIYPPVALAAHAGRVKVMMQFTIDREGRVINATPSFAGIPFNGPFTLQFQAAAEAAMAQWRFHPAEVRHLVPREEGGETIWSLAWTEKRETVTEVSFTFTETGRTALDKKKP